VETSILFFRTFLYFKHFLSPFATILPATLPFLQKLISFFRTLLFLTAPSGVWFYSVPQLRIINGKHVPVLRTVVHSHMPQYPPPSLTRFFFSRFMIIVFQTFLPLLPFPRNNRQLSLYFPTSLVPHPVSLPGLCFCIVPSHVGLFAI